MSTLEELAELYELEPFYWDVNGVQQVASEKSKLAALTAMGIVVDTPEHVEAALLERRESLWEETLPQTIVRFEHELPLQLPVRLPGWAFPEFLDWSCELEDGSKLSGRAGFQDGVVEEHQSPTRGRLLLRNALIEVAAPAGYHRLNVSWDGHSAENLFFAVAPSRCFLPAGDKRFLGVAVQLYSLRSERNWGIGDLRDLRAAIPVFKAHGIECVGLNPLHALFERDADQFSPYSPCSRMAWNTLIICVEDVPEFQFSEAAAELVSSPGFDLRLKAARVSKYVDYKAVWDLKFEVLELLFEEFSKQLGSGGKRAESFNSFVRDGGDALENSALYSALREYFLGLDSNNWGFPVWPVGYKSPQDHKIDEFRNSHASRVQFYRYLQFLADNQLQLLADEMEQAGLAPGLYFDLALGANSGGAEAWANQEQLCFHASSGAPPDELGPLGQVWGLPPFIPERFTAAEYRPFIEAVRFAMRHAGVLRIDHVMSICRLFWIPNGCTADEGIYVRYPFHDLMALATLESVRNRCVLIGEDLGTVPESVRDGMKSVSMLSYKVLYFMREKVGFVPPEKYPHESLVCCSTHDLAPLKSYFNGKDIALRQELNLIASSRIHQRMKQLRASDLQGLEKLLLSAGYDVSTAAYSEELALACHEFLARTLGLLQVIQVEDLLQQEEQANLPGTVTEHPNWKRKYRSALWEIVREDFASKLLARCVEQRSK